MKINLCTDRALVTSPCLRIRTRRREFFLWWNRRPRLYRGAGDTFTVNPS
jgi:hypothetical protein